jgi:hypothetical protein
MWSPEVVPWWIIHPQNNHQTFWPAWNVYPTNDCCDVLLLWHFTTATLQPCNVLLLWHFDPIMFYFCDISTPIWYIQKLTSTLLLRWTSCHCVRTSTFFFTWIVYDVHFSFEVKCGHLEVFWLLWWGVDDMSQWSKSRPDYCTYWPMDQMGVCPNLI